jgi:pimeloyl-ACP methyl ester carboxylesterase
MKKEEKKISMNMFPLKLAAAIGSALLLLMNIPAVHAQAVTSVTVPGGDAGISINLLRTVATKPSGQAPILLLHAYGAPCAEAYDLPGFSLMHELSATGRDIFAMDARGFGRSSKPVQPAPVGRATDAVKDVVKVIEYILKTTGAKQVALFGWSWGGVVAPMVAIERPELVERLAVFGAMYAYVLPMMTQPFAARDDPAHFSPIAMAYQKIETGKVLGHWRMMLAGRKNLVDDATITKVEALAERCSAGAPSAAPGFTVRPMGPLQDLFEIWNNRPIYDAALVKVPTLVIRGDLDSFADTALAAKLPLAREVVIADATHWLPYEKHRGILVAVLRNFFAGK